MRAPERVAQGARKRLVSPPATLGDGALIRMLC
jgi:hypothetical protein